MDKEEILKNIESRITGVNAFLNYQRDHNTREDVRLRSPIFFDEEVLLNEINRLKKIRATL